MEKAPKKPKAVLTPVKAIEPAPEKPIVKERVITPNPAPVVVETPQERAEEPKAETVEVIENKAEPKVVVETKEEKPVEYISAVTDLINDIEAIE